MLSWNDYDCAVKSIEAGQLFYWRWTTGRKLIPRNCNGTLQEMAVWTERTSSESIDGPFALPAPQGVNDGHFAVKNYFQPRVPACLLCMHMEDVPDKIAIKKKKGALVLRKWKWDGTVEDVKVMKPINWDSQIENGIWGKKWRNNLMSQSSSVQHKKYSSKSLGFQKQGEKCKNSSPAIKKFAKKQLFSVQTTSTFDFHRCSSVDWLIDWYWLKLVSEMAQTWKKRCFEFQKK